MIQQDYAEILLNTIDVVVAERMRDQKFDETIVCTIKDVSRAAQGLYVVSNGTIKFDAYSDVTNYEVDEAVRVTIAKGDYSQKKYIIGKAVSEKNGNQPIISNSPSSQILNITGNIVSDNVSGGIIANDPNNGEILIWSMILDDDYTNTIYDSISLKASFQTFFQPYKVYRGEYGLYLRAAIRPTTEGGKWINRTYYLSSKDMFGDPYNYLIASSQEAKFGFDVNEQIAALSLYLYQENDFYYIDDSGTSRVLSPYLTNNIQVSNIMIGLGTDLTNVEDNKVVIHTDDKLVYNSPNSQNEKTIKIIWYNKDENNKYIGFSDGIVDKDYDELEYSKKLSNHQRIAAWGARSDLPNDYAVYELVARADELSAAKKDLKKLISQDLYREIKAFKNSMSSIQKGEDLQVIFNSWIGAFDKEDSNGDTWVQHLDKLNDAYKDKLALISGTADEEISWGGSLHTYENNLFGNIEDGIKDGGSLYPFTTNIIASGQSSILNQILDWIELNAPNYLGSYNNYRVRVEKLNAKIEEKALKIRDISLGTQYKMYTDLSPVVGQEASKTFTSNYLFEDNTEGLQVRLLKDTLDYRPYDIKAFNKHFKEESANRYQIYWYYARSGYVAGESENHFGGDGWCAIEDPAAFNNISRFTINNTVVEKDEVKIVPNIGLPNIDELNDGDFYPNKPDTDESNGYLSITFSAERPDIQEEKIKAVIIYNHEVYESNILTFNNDDPAAGPELTNDIQIVHGANSRDVYASYGVDNTLINAIDFNTKRELRVQYLNERGEPESRDETALKDSTIYWYVPADATMIRLVDSDLSDFECGSAENRTFVYYKDADSGEQKLLYKINRVAISIENGYKVVHNGKVYEGTLKEIAQAIKKAESVINTVTFTPITTTDGTRYDSQITYTYDINNDNGFISGLAYGGITYSFVEKGNNKYIVSSDNTQYRMRAKSENSNEIEVTLPIDILEAEDKTGFIYYYKLIQSVDDLTFTYRIKDYYSASFKNNSITCKVIKNNQMLESNIHLDFNSAGSNGTSYTLRIESKNDEAAMTTLKDGYYYYDFIITLFDYENNMIPFNETPTVVVLNELESQIGQPIALSPASSGENGVLSYTGTLMVSKQNQPQTYVLKVTAKKPWPITSDSLVELICYYPVPWALSNQYFASVPTSIIYDSLGTNPSYHKDPMCLYQRMADNTATLITGVHWTIENNTENYISLNGHENGKAKLVPCTMYLSNYKTFPVLKCVGNDGSTVFWYQPLYVAQNQYGSTLLNNWDGSLTINKDDGTILSTMVGAGVKNNNNSFSGVLMGNIQRTTELNVDGGNNLERSLLNPQTGIGLYGFHENAQSFGFNINGTAFIGKSGSGRISFDGNHGFIYSSNWLASFEKNGGGYDNPFKVNGNTVTLNQGKAGMAIDLQNGHIDAYNFKLTGKGIELNAHPEDGNYFFIGQKDDNGKWITDGTEPYLKYDAQGSLNMKVSSLELTGTLGGPNLLNNTTPREALSLTEDEVSRIDLRHWSKTSLDSTNVGRVVAAKKDGKYCVGLQYNFDMNNRLAWYAEGGYWYNTLGKNPDNISSEDKVKNKITSKKIYQYLGEKTTDTFKSGKYTLSGEICYVDGEEELSDKERRKITFRFGFTSGDYIDKNIIVTPNQWTSINETFEISKDKNVNYCLQIYDATTTPSEFLNGGSVYFHHLKLEKGTITTDWRISEQDVKDNYEEYSDNTAKQKIETLDNQLNQDNIFNRLTNNGFTKGIWLGDVTDDGIKDLYINANYISTGILRSENWDGQITLRGKPLTFQQYIDLSEDQKSEVTISATTGMYINLNNGKIWGKDFDIESQNFKLNAWNSADAKGLWLDSNPIEDNNYYFLVGNHNDSYIGYTKGGNLTIKANSLYISNQSIDSYIEGKIPGQLTYNEIMKMISDGWEGIYAQDGKYYLSASYIKAGQIDANNVSIINLKANNITGTLPNGVKVGGWIIGNTSLYSNLAVDGSSSNSNFMGLYSSYQGDTWTKLYGANSRNWRILIGISPGSTFLYDDADKKNIGNAFGVANNGAVFATSATFPRGVKANHIYATRNIFVGTAPDYVTTSYYPDGHSHIADPIIIDKILSGSAIGTWRVDGNEGKESLTSTYNLGSGNSCTVTVETEGITVSYGGSSGGYTGSCSWQQFASLLNQAKTISISEEL